jgi:hypothetical protein
MGFQLGSKSFSSILINRGVKMGDSLSVFVGMKMGVGMC